MHVALFVDDKVETFGVVTQAVHNVVLSGGVGTPNWWSGSHEMTTFPINTSRHTSLTYVTSESTKSDLSQNNAFVKMLQDDEDIFVTFLQRNDHLTSC